ncbi:hypothetical protein OC834_003150 [Tilletia horrida]|nr:hypothetical protein OC834_003150 [Tilletia horrida]
MPLVDTRHSPPAGAGGGVGAAAGGGLGVGVGVGTGAGAGAGAAAAAERPRPPPRPGAAQAAASSAASPTALPLSHTTTHTAYQQGSVSMAAVPAAAAAAAAVAVAAAAAAASASSSSSSSSSSSASADSPAAASSPQAAPSGGRGGSSSNTTASSAHYSPEPPRTTASALNSQRRYYLAVDCGGTKAAAAIACSHPVPGTIIGTGTGGPANYTDISTGTFLRNVRSAIENASFKAKLVSRDQVPECISGGSSSGSGFNSLAASTVDLASLAPTSNHHQPLDPDAFDITKVLHRRRSAIQLGTLGTPEAEAREIPLPRFQAAWFAVAGVDSPGDVIKLKPHLNKMLRLEPEQDNEAEDSGRRNSSEGNEPGLEGLREPALIVPPPPPLPHDRLSEPSQEREEIAHAGPAGGLTAPQRARLVVANDTSLLAAPLQQSSAPFFSSGSSSSSAIAQGKPEEQTAVVVIAGTGSIVTSYRRDDKGAVEPIGRAGGFGWLLGDEGSGFAVGREAIRRVLERANREQLRACKLDAPPSAGSLPPIKEDNNAHTSASSASSPAPKLKRGHLLRNTILSHWKLDSTDELLSAVYRDRTPVPWSLRNSRVVPPTPSSQAGLSSRRTSTVSSDRYSDPEEEAREALTMQKADTITPEPIIAAGACGGAGGSGSGAAPVVMPEERVYAEREPHTTRPDGKGEGEGEGEGRDIAAGLLRNSLAQHTSGSSGAAEPSLSLELDTPRPANASVFGGNAQSSSSTPPTPLRQAAAGSAGSEQSASGDADVGREFLRVPEQASAGRFGVNRCSSSISARTIGPAGSGTSSGSSGDASSGTAAAAPSPSSSVPSSPITALPPSSRTPPPSGLMIDVNLANSAEGSSGAELQLTSSTMLSDMGPGEGSAAVAIAAAGGPSASQLVARNSGRQSLLGPIVGAGTGAGPGMTGVVGGGATSGDPTFVHQMGERKHRLASLSTLVFQLAFEKGDRESLSILRAQARELARHIVQVVVSDHRRGADRRRRNGDEESDSDEEESSGSEEEEDDDDDEDAPDADDAGSLPKGSAQPTQEAHQRRRRRGGKVDASRSVLCTSGSLLGEESYRRMLEEECRKLGKVRFRRCVYIGRPASSGAQALAQMWERDRPQMEPMAQVQGQAREGR